MTTAAIIPPVLPPTHSLFEDILALLIGAIFVSLGIAMFNQAGLLTGGTAGLAFLIHYATKIPFGMAFFVQI